MSEREGRGRAEGRAGGVEGVWRSLASARDMFHDEEFTRLAETRLAQNSLRYTKIAQHTLDTSNYLEE